jgi:membrane protein DedA with SNARE-associated domain
MQTTIAFLIRHGYLVVFVFVFLEQLGLPLPTFPILLAAGALAGSGQMHFGAALLLAVCAALLADAFWFTLSRRRGSAVLRWICRISLEPDSCVRHTEDVYAKHGARSLLAAKFIPGLNAVAAPLAGVFGMRLTQFVLYDVSGVLLWAASYIGGGYLFSGQLEDVAHVAMRLGQFLVVLIVGLVAGYIGRKYYQRQKFIRELRIARISPVILKRMMDAGEAVQIVDLRHSLDFEADSATLPGAMHFDPQDIDSMLPKISLDRDVIVYCT